MSSAKKSMKSIIRKMDENISGSNPKQIEDMVNEIIYTKAKDGRIFVAGTGRSGLVGKAFAMRLYHLGFDVVVLGETIVPSASKRDCVVAISGSGKTDFTVDTAALARKIGTRVIGVTSEEESPLAKISDIVVIVKGRTKEMMDESKEKFKWDARQITGLHAPLSPLGSLFELTVMLFLEGIIAALIEKLNISEDAIKERHANIETITS